MRRSHKRRRMTAAETLIAIAAVFCGVVACAGMILHMKLFPVTRTLTDGTVYTARISLIERMQGWQPFLGESGSLESKDYEMTPVTEPAGIRNGTADDGLELDQIQEGQFCVLFLGTDESRTNTDVIMLVMFDLRGGAVHILQIPRDTFVPGYTSFVGGKLNSVYTHGHPNKAPVQRVVDCLETIFRVPIDRYVTAGCNDIAAMVDLIGGVPVDMPYAITYEADKIIPAGEQMLSGEQAEWLLRFRHDYTEGDIGRLKAQRIFMAAAVSRIQSVSSMALLRVIHAAVAQQLVESDLSVDEMRKLADFVASIGMEQITLHLLPGESYRYEPPVTDGGGIAYYSVWVMHKQPVIDLLNQYFRPYFAPEDTLPIAEILKPEEYQYTGYDSDGTDLDSIANGDTFQGE